VAGSSSNGETNYWPGFVDALTNTVIAMVFLVIVMVISLSVFVNVAVEQRGKAMAAEMLVKELEARGLSAKASPGSGPANGGLTAGVGAAGQAPPSTANASVLQGNLTIKDDAAKNPNVPPGRSQEQSGNALVLRFSGTSVEIDDSTERELDAIAARTNVTFAQMRASIVVRGPEIYLSENQRLAFFRAMSARNYLLKKGISGGYITVRLEDVPGTTESVAVVSVSARAPENR
jgi:hypothetical protein